MCRRMTHAGFRSLMYSVRDAGQGEKRLGLLLHSQGRLDPTLDALHQT